MNTQPLRAAYDTFHRMAESGPFSAPTTPGKWTAELIVAHMVVIDRLLATTIAELIAGRAPTHDNRSALRDHHLRAIVAAAGDWPGLIAAAHQSAAVVCTLINEVDPETAARPFPLFLLNGEAVVFDAPAQLTNLIDGQARMHLPGHTAQLQALRAT